MVSLGAIVVLGVDAHVSLSNWMASSFKCNEIWQYKLYGEDDWFDYVRFDPYNPTTYQPYEQFKEWIESRGGEARKKHQ